MDRPPRDLAEDRLIDGPLIRYSYLIAGMAEVGSIFCYKQGSLLGGAGQGHARPLIRYSCLVAGMAEVGGAHPRKWRLLEVLRESWLAFWGKLVI